MLKATKFLALVMVIMLLCTLSVFGAHKPTVDVKRGSVPIDTNIDDIWQYVEEMKLDVMNPAVEDAGPVSDYAKVYAKMLWDDDNLYILMVAYDNTPFTEPGPLSQEDCFEVFFSLNNTRSEAYTEVNQWRFLFDVATPFDETCMRNLPNISENPLQYMEIAGTATSYGYMMKLRLNKGIGIDFDLKPGQIIGIDFGYDDNTDGGAARAAQICWNTEGANVAGVPNAMGTIRLVMEDALPPPVEEVVEDVGGDEGAAETSAPATKPPTAAQTSDALIALISLVSVSGLGITFVSRKRK